VTLDELRVRDLGVIDDLTLLLGPGMTALTGETGAGKTLVVEAIELLLGGRADSLLVRPGATETWVEGRFAHPAGEANTVTAEDDDEVILVRTVAVHGRSRAYVNGRMANLAALGEHGTGLVDLHGQHGHQALLSPATQRSALDAAAGVDHQPVIAARLRLRRIADALASMGGDERTRARELDLLRYQLNELDGAALSDLAEDEALTREETLLSGATADRAAALAARSALADEDGDGGALEALGVAQGALAGRPPFAELHRRLSGLSAELADVARDLRALGEELQENPDRLESIRLRRQLLRDLRRKYGETLGEVMAETERIRTRVEELGSHEQRAAALEAEQRAARADLLAAQAVVGDVRRRFAPQLAKAIETRLRELAMPRARFDIALGNGVAADEVTWLLAANPGEPALPLARVASGGELARTMLAARLELSLGGGERGLPARTLVFDEVDAGIGGEAALAVGGALAALGRHHQVLVVTHLAQVAAFADHHLTVTKVMAGERTVARVAALDGNDRVIELSRMLSGQPSSETARRHAEELLATAGVR
jgi:DNA repair protein RecN (Recombination protein N)